MTVPTQENQAQEQQASNKELNFRALEQKYQQQLSNQQAENQRLQQELQNKARLPYKDDDQDEDDSEPYVDHKRLKKEQAKFGQQIKQETQSEIQRAVHIALNEERKKNWMKSNPDFTDVMNKAEQFAQQDPDLAESILKMPDGFERQQLVYHMIKSKGLHKPQIKEPTIQEKIDANRRSPYYQPSGTGTSPYSQGSDFSPAGQQQGYEKIKQLKSQLRI